MKINVIGAGYVGVSNAFMLSKNNDVTLTDINKDIIDILNSGKLHIKDKESEDMIAKGINITFSNDSPNDSDYYVLAVPTNYNPQTNKFDTKILETVIKNILNINKTGTIIIKSTVPVGYTKSISKELDTDRIIFSPEFLREGKALYDNLNPSRIIAGSTSKEAKIFADLLKDSCDKKDVNILLMDSSEAEAVKLFSNTYLALRVAYFNELDTYAELRNINSESIIKGVCLDPRIGDNYNNPSFGFGGYCLPKDTKQLKANFNDVPENIITAIVDSNITRKDHITDSILSKNPKVVGVYRLTMKEGSDNFRASAIKGIIQRLTSAGTEVIIHEPIMKEKEFEGNKLVNDLKEFKSKSDIIVANRYHDELSDIKDKLYTRDLFKRD